MMDEATIRKRCAAVFRAATGHPSFIGRGGVDLRDVFAGMIRDAYADGLAASERELQAIRDTVGDTEFALRQQLADMTRERDDWQKSAQQFNGTYEALHQRVAEAQRTTDQLRAEYRRIDSINHDLEQQLARLRETENPR